MHSATLPLLLKQLGLPSMYNTWEEYDVTTQKQHWSYPQYLTALSELEVTARYQKRVQRHLKEAKLPPGKTLVNFDFKAVSINAAQIKALAENTSWIKQAENLIIFGPSGVGKTHIAAAISSSLIAQGIRVLFMSTTTLVQQLQLAKVNYKLPEALVKLSRYPLLVLDDIGYAKKDDAETSVLFELIADRYETGSLIITANQAFSEWNKIFPDNMMAVAAIDRLVHHATIINLNEEDSYRRNNAKQGKKPILTSKDN
jgi:DNA replication protein DnaC